MQSKTTKWREFIGKSWKGEKVPIPHFCNIRLSWPGKVKVTKAFSFDLDFIFNDMQSKSKQKKGQFSAWFYFPIQSK